MTTESLVDAHSGTRCGGLQGTCARLAVIF